MSDSKLIELLYEVYDQYAEGLYDSEFDDDVNDMCPPVEVINLMAEIRSVLPPRFTDEEAKEGKAAQAMRDLSEEEKDSAMTENVIDMRKEFALKMSKNQGAYGLVQKFIDCNEKGDQEGSAEIYDLMQELLHGPPSE